MKKTTVTILITLIASISTFAHEVKPTRPQEPQMPYPYYSEDLIFENKQAGINLAGTLTLPQKEGIFPAVILISGSGPQNRDEELAGHKPFLVLSDYLTRNGIAVLRYDDRGTAYSEGDFKSATSVDFAADVKCAIDYLKTRKEINPDKIGLVGHSEGGLIAPLVAIDTKDVAFMIMLGGPGIRGEKILLIQQGLIAEVQGTDEEQIRATEKMNRKIFRIVKKDKDMVSLQVELRQELELFLNKNSHFKIPDELTKDEFIDLQIDTYVTPWMKYFLKYNPALTLKKIKIPVLALYGGNDLQITSQENTKALKKAFKKARNYKVTIKELPDLNHLFQESKTGSPLEYQVIEQTYSQVMLEEVLNWLKKQVE